MKRQNGFAPVLLTLIVAAICLFGYVVYRGLIKNISTTTTTNTNIAAWKIYNNAKYHYSIEYPSDWVYREYPNTQTGAGFRPDNEPNDLNHEYVSVDYLKKALDMVNMPFEEYVKKAAVNDIQNYISLASLIKITTSTGLIGYETTWNVQSMGKPSGTTTISTPITYFPINGDNMHVIIVSGGVNGSIDIYNKMIATFKLTK